MYAISKPQQWLGDIAIRESGIFEATLEMALINNIGITDVVDPGTNLKTAGAIDKRVVDYYRSDSIYPATAGVFENVKQGGGVNYMAVEINFIVS